jgi:hypothetical protein
MIGAGGGFQVAFNAGEAQLLPLLKSPLLLKKIFSLSGNIKTTVAVSSAVGIRGDSDWCISV